MSVSAIFGTRLVVVPNSISTTSPSSSRIGNGIATKSVPMDYGLAIECSSRPQKKGTKHHMKTRPRKTQPWDVKRRPTVYAPLPQLPPEWTLVSQSDTAEAADVPPQPLLIE